MTVYKEAVRMIRQIADRRRIKDVETVALAAALGRVAALQLISRTPIPPFDNSAMDGYAVAAASVQKTPMRLPVLGTTFAGDAPRHTRKTGAWRIMTGAPIPGGCNAVIPVEKTVALNGGGIVEFLERAAPEDFVRGKGRDFPANAEVCPAGTRLGPRHLLALAAAGVARVPVLRKPSVALIATGRELAAPGAALKRGKIRDASSAYLAATLPALGAEFDFRGIVADDAKDFKRRLEKTIADGRDLVLTTGAVSMGEADFIPSALRDLGAHRVFHKVAIRPGKPIFFALFPKGPLFIGLPGNPISTVVGLRFFVEPCLRALLGRPQEIPILSPLASRAEKPEGLRCFFKARRARGGQVETLPGQASFQIRSLLAADCWAVLPENGKAVAAGTMIDVYSLSEALA